MNSDEVMHEWVVAEEIDGDYEWYIAIIKASEYKIYNIYEIHPSLPIVSLYEILYTQYK